MAVPLKTVFPTPFMPGRSSSTGMKLGDSAKEIRGTASKKSDRRRPDVFLMGSVAVLSKSFSIRKLIPHIRRRAETRSTEPVFGPYGPVAFDGCQLGSNHCPRQVTFS